MLCIPTHDFNKENHNRAINSYPTVKYSKPYEFNEDINLLIALYHTLEPK